MNFKVTPAVAVATWLLVLVLAVTGTGMAAAQLVINEILADPASDWDGDGAVDFRGDEWIEILNAGATSLDLGGYGLRDAAVATPRIVLSGVLAPGETTIVFGSQAVAWQEANGVTAAGLSLNNSGDEVVLLRVVPGTDPPVVEDVDRVDYPDHAADDDRSCGWDTYRTEWVLFDALAPYTGDRIPAGTGCPPTPGASNLCHGEVGTESVSFGAAKALYR